MGDGAVIPPPGSQTKRGSEKGEAAFESSLRDACNTCLRVLGYGHVSGKADGNGQDTALSHFCPLGRLGGP